MDMESGLVVITEVGDERAQDSALWLAKCEDQIMKDLSEKESEKDQVRGQPGECHVPKPASRRGDRGDQRYLRDRVNEDLELTIGLTMCVSIVTLARAVWGG